LPNDKTTGSQSLEIVEPIGKRVLIRKDQDKKQTKGGIQLPDNIEIPTITGRVVTISAEVENCQDIPLRQYDKVLFNPKGAIPVDFEGDNRLFVVEIENVVSAGHKPRQTAHLGRFIDKLRANSAFAATLSCAAAVSSRRAIVHGREGR